MKWYFHRSQKKTGWGSLSLVGFVAIALVLVTNIVIANASTPLDIGYFDFNYPPGTGANGEPTGEKPQSKLWYHDGSWWGSLWSVAGNAYHIYQLDWNTQTWIDTGVELDNRIETRADTLTDGDTLYVISNVYHDRAQNVSAGSRGQFYRYSYNAGTYELDDGFPIEVTDSRGESHVIAKDSTGRLWVTYTVNQQVMLTYSNANGGGDLDWAQPFVLPVATSSTAADDTSSIIAFDGYIGVMWSRQLTNNSMHFAVHKDSDPTNQWKTKAIYTVSGDDHMSLRSLQSDNAGKVFALFKTSAPDGAPGLIMLGVCDSASTDCVGNGDWDFYPVFTGASTDPTRMVMSIDVTNRDIYVFGHIRNGLPKTGSNIYYKRSDLDNISFPGGVGTPIISSTKYTAMNNVSTMRQNADASTGIVVIAADDVKRAYVHGCIDLSTHGSSVCLSPNSEVATHYGSASYQISEHGGISLTVSVELTLPSAVPVSVKYATSDGTATAGLDYVATSGTMTFAPGELSKTFQIPIIDDALAEDPETINLTLSDGPTTFPETAVVTLYDDDKIPQVSFAATSFEGQEDLGNGVFAVELSSPFHVPVSVHYATSNGTAVAPGDYTSQSGTITFNPTETYIEMPVTLIDDALQEPTEQFNLTLSSPVSATLGTPATATMSIIDDDEPPNVALSSDSFVVNENAGPATVTVLLDDPSDTTVAVDYWTKNITAIAPGDYTAIPTTTLTFNPGETQKTFNITINNDALQEFSESARVRIDDPTNAVLSTPNDAILAIIDDDTPPVVRFSNVTYSVLENKGWVEVDVELSFPFNATMQVDYTTLDDVALAGADYSTVSGTVIFSPFETKQTIYVPITEDINYEQPETLKLKLLNPVVTSLSVPNITTVTIYDNDAPPSVAFQSASYTVNEGAGTAAVQLQLTGSSFEPVAVQVTSSNNSATAGSDFVQVNELVTFTPGSKTAVLQVPIVDDPVMEPAENLTLTLSNPQHAALGALTSASLTITDNDNPPTVSFEQASYEFTENNAAAAVSVQLSAPSLVTVTVNYASSNGTAVAGSDYQAISGALTFPAGTTSLPLPLPLINDNIEESNETFSLALSSPVGAGLGAAANATVLILDDEVPPVAQFTVASLAVDENVGTVQGVVTLSNPSDKIVTVDYTFGNDSAVAPADYTGSNGTLTFAPGETSKQIAINIVDDNTYELEERFTVTLSNWVNSLQGTRSVLELLITSDETEPTVQFGGFSYALVENGGAVPIQVTLSTPSDFPVTVDYATSNNTAVAGNDYNVASGTLSFAPGETAKTFTVTVFDDVLDETNETVTLHLSNMTNAQQGNPDEVTLTIIDDDAAPTLSFTTGSITVSEDSVTAVLNVVLSAESGKTLHVPISIINGTAKSGQDFLLGSDKITLVPGETSKKVTVQIIDDQVSELNETFTVKLGDPGDALLGDITQAVVTIEDNDPPGVQFTDASTVIDEHGVRARIEVSVTEPMPSPFSVQLRTVDKTAVSGEDYRPVNITLNFVKGELNKHIFVDILDDDVSEGSETFELELFNVQGTTLAAQSVTEVVIEDNDQLPMLSFAQGNYTGFEGNGSVTVRLVLSAASGQVVTANYMAVDGTAVNGSDYTLTSGTVLFTPGQTSKTITIPLVVDGVDEAEETFSLQLITASNADLGLETAVVHIKEGKGGLLFLPIIFN